MGAGGEQQMEEIREDFMEEADHRNIWGLGRHHGGEEPGLCSQLKSQCPPLTAL